MYPHRGAQTIPPSLSSVEWRPVVMATADPPRHDQRYDGAGMVAGATVLAPWARGLLLVAVISATLWMVEPPSRGRGGRHRHHNEGSSSTSSSGGGDRDPSHDDVILVGGAPRGRSARDDSFPSERGGGVGRDDDDNHPAGPETPVASTQLAETRRHRASWRAAKQEEEEDGPGSGEEEEAQETVSAKAAHRRALAGVAKLLGTKSFPPLLIIGAGDAADVFTALCVAYATVVATRGRGVSRRPTCPRYGEHINDERIVSPSDGSTLVQFLYWARGSIPVSIRNAEGGEGVFFGAMPIVVRKPDLAVVLVGRGILDMMIYDTQPSSPMRSVRCSLHCAKVASAVALGCRAFSFCCLDSPLSGQCT